MYEQQNKNSRIDLDIFAAMKIAEAIIADFKLRHKGLEDKIDKAFIILKPTAEEMKHSHNIYKKHCIELLERTIRGQDTSMITDAEILCAMHRFLIQAKLTEKGKQIAEYIFYKIMGYNECMKKYSKEEIKNIEEKISEIKHRFRINRTHTEYVDDIEEPMAQSLK